MFGGWLRECQSQNLSAHFAALREASSRALLCGSVPLCLCVKKCCAAAGLLCVLWSNSTEGIFCRTHGTAQGPANLGGCQYACGAQHGGNGDGRMILTQRHRDTKAQRCLEGGFANVDPKTSLRTLRLCVRHPRAPSSVAQWLCASVLKNAVPPQSASVLSVCREAASVCSVVQAFNQ